MRAFAFSSPFLLSTFIHCVSHRPQFGFWNTTYSCDVVRVCTEPFVLVQFSGLVRVLLYSGVENRPIRKRAVCRSLKISIVEKLGCFRLCPISIKITFATHFNVSFFFAFLLPVHRPTCSTISSILLRVFYIIALNIICFLFYIWRHVYTHADILDTHQTLVFSFSDTTHTHQNDPLAIYFKTKEEDCLLPLPSRLHRKATLSLLFVSVMLFFFFLFVYLLFFVCFLVSFTFWTLFCDE